MTRKLFIAFALVIAVELGGCASSPATNFYTLSLPAEPAQRQANASYTVAIGAVALPDDVDRPQLVVRTGTNQIYIADFDRWAGAPKDEIARAMAVYLSQALADANVFTYSRTAAPQPDYTVVLDLQRFESVLGEAANVDVLWQVRPATGPSQTGRSTVTEPATGASYAAVVEALSLALKAVGRDIARTIQEAHGGGK